MEIAFTVLSIVWLSLLVIMWRQLLVHVRGLRRTSHTLDEKDLPTVSLCIPARNENHALSESLVSAIASHYPKLEILVLDDCSQDKTSQIIRGFSHEGVRFVQGDTPSEGWLGKNNAYATLYEHARGEYLVFMSVDTRVSETTILEIVSYMQSNALAMMSILPTRDNRYMTSVLLAPLRYFWQLVFSTRSHPPVSTSLWALRTDSMREMDGFSRFRQEILLENMLASFFAARGTFRFIQANSYIRATYAKHWSSQLQTSIRLFFPLMRKSYLVAEAMLVVYILFLVTPIMLLISSSSPWSFLVVYLQLGLTIGIYILYLFYMTGNTLFSLLASFLLPVVLLQEIGLMVLSCIQYARGKVDWKGRNICFPSSSRFTR